MTVSEILDAIGKLEPEQVELLMQALDHGMWDEWDTSFVGGIEMGFGGQELALAARTGAGWVRYMETHGGTNG